MRKTHIGRLLTVLSVLAVGFVFGGTFALANKGDSPDIDITTYDEVLDVDGTVVVEGSEGFVVFTDAARKETRVQVRGWDAIVKRGLLSEGSTVRVTGADVQGKVRKYRGHVTVLK